MDSKKFLLISLLVSGVLFLFSIYTYTQIDLNLTLSSNIYYQDIQKTLIYLGYFNRSLSTLIFLIFIIALFVIYFILIRLVNQEELTRNQIICLVMITVCFLIFAYPAFSHDIFNYMFDARIITKYHLNPYLYKALDFPDDLWIRFMHWTHRTYPYGPVWLIITLPLSILGSGKFVLTLLLYKLAFAFFHLGNIFIIYKLLSRLKAKNTFSGVVFYAFNPLVIIESLVSPHNEVMMLFFLLLSLYLFYTQKNYIKGAICLFLSIGIKFLTIILMPYFIWKKFILKEKSANFNLMYIYLLLALVIFFETLYREPYPWYFIILIGTGSLILQMKYVYGISTVISLAAILRYAPYLYTGSYTDWVVLMQNILFITGLTFFLCFVILDIIRLKIKKSL